MSLLTYLKSFVYESTFTPGSPVNRVSLGGTVLNNDGVVIAHQERGVLVEWARGGSSVVPARELALVLG